ncbi:hypothetical protein B484DRAFT_118233 [Ochromonadaceae sp. CCMP2298]|nr:hypothetical protein B484DRAFT_118233 [Ochromonadaceae sp. CCMP2298]
MQIANTRWAPGLGQVASFVPTYTGWERDADTMRDMTINNSNNVPIFLAKMQRKQSLVTRSAPELRMLDSLVSAGLTYAEWQADVAQAEYLIVEYGHNSRDSHMPGHLKLMERKQAVACRDRSVPYLRQLYELESSLTYCGWRSDVAQVEYLFIGNEPHKIAFWLERMERSQAVASKGRSMSHLRELYELEDSGLTYPGWRSDVGEIERAFIDKSDSVSIYLRRTKALQVTEEIGMSILDMSAGDDGLSAMQRAVTKNLVYIETSQKRNDRCREEIALALRMNELCVIWKDIRERKKEEEASALTEEEAEEEEEEAPPRKSRRRA